MRPPSRRRAVGTVAAVLALLFSSGAAAHPAGPHPGSGLTANGQGTLVVIGDSLMEGTTVIGSLRSRLVSLRTWPAVVVDYKRGRTTSEGAAALARRLATVRNPTAIVVSLGTNDMLHNTKYEHAATVIESLMQETLGLPVMWVNISFSRGHPDWRVRAARFNRALLAARDEWPNLSVADWSRSFVPSGRSNYIADGIHLTNSGYRTRAAWLALRTARFGESIIASTSTTTSTTVASTVPPTTTSTIPATTVPG